MFKVLFTLHPQFVNPKSVTDRQSQKTANSGLHPLNARIAKQIAGPMNPIAVHVFRKTPRDIVCLKLDQFCPGRSTKKDRFTKIL